MSDTKMEFNSRLEDTPEKKRKRIAGLISVTGMTQQQAEVTDDISAHAGKSALDRLIGVINTAPDALINIALCHALMMVMNACHQSIAQLLLANEREAAWRQLEEITGMSRDHIANSIHRFDEAMDQFAPGVRSGDRSSVH